MEHCIHQQQTNKDSTTNNSKFSDSKTICDYAGAYITKNKRDPNKS